MEAVFLKLVNMSITASYLVLAVIALRLVFRKAPKWIFCVLWGLVALRLICPFSLESVLSLIPAAEPLPSNIIYTAHPEIQSGVAVIDKAVNPLLGSSLTPVSPAVSANPTQILSFLLSRIWAVGAAGMLLYALVSFLLIYRRVATAIPVEKNIKRSEFIDTPFVLGLVRPVIYLPACMASEDTPYVIAHEQAHIRRRDHWWKPLGFALLSVYWFNPAMWVAYILLCRDIEAACDEKVIQEMAQEGRRAYSTALLNCSISRRRIAACPLAFGEVGVKDRVKRVMNYKKPAFWVVLAAVVLGIVMAVCFLTNPKEDLCFSAGNVTPRGLTLECKPKSALENLVFDGDFRLEVKGEDGTWEQVEPIGALVPVAQGDDRMIYGEARPDGSGWELDWSANYGILPPGDYRIGITAHFQETGKETLDGSSADSLTVYTILSTPGETHYVTFSVGVSSAPYVWFDLYGTSGETPRELHRSIRVPGVDGVTLTYTTDSNGKDILLDSRVPTPLMSGDVFRSICFADLSGDGVCELYATVQNGDRYSIQSYDWRTGRLSRLQAENTVDSFLAVQDNCLFLLKKDRREYGATACFQLRRTADGELESAPLDARGQNLTRQVTGISIRGAGWTSLYDPAQLETMLTLLRNLEGGVTAAPEEALEEAKHSLNSLAIQVEYALGKTVLHFTPDFSLAWRNGDDCGYLLSNPEPLHSYVTELTDMVMDRETSGTPFASADEPWNWTANITASAVATARGNVCQSISQGSNTTYMDTVSGYVTADTLNTLLTLLNAVPQAAFVPGETVVQKNFEDVFRGFCQLGSAFAILDNVNDLAGVLRWYDGKLELLLTDQSEQFGDTSAPYLTDARLWSIRNEPLQAFMQQFYEYPSVVYDTTGGE